MITQDEAKQLRHGNVVTHHSDMGDMECALDAQDIYNIAIAAEVNGQSELYSPIPLSEELLLRLGFEKNPNFAIGNPLNLSLGRNRTLVVSSVGTPNEMVFIREENKVNGVADEPDLVVIRNYDYDGKTYVHHIQNIASDFGQELTLKTK